MTTSAFSQENTAKNEVVEELSKQALQVLQDRCYRCHGGTSTFANLDVKSEESLFGIRGDEKRRIQWVVPGNTDDSILWDVIDLSLIHI